MEINTEKIEYIKNKGKNLKEKYYKREKLVSLFGYATVFVLILLLNFFATPGFSIDNLIKWTWWIPNIIVSIAGVVLMRTRLNDKIFELKDLADDIKEIDNTFNKKVAESRFDSNDLDDYLTDINKKNKIAAYKAVIELKIKKLNRRFRFSKKGINVWYGGSEAEKLKSKYCRLRSNIEAELSDLDNRIDYIDVDYQEWTYPSLMAGVQTEALNHKKIKTASEFVNAESSKKGLSRMLSAVLFATITTGTMDWTDWSSLPLTFTRLFSMISIIILADQLAHYYIDGDFKRFSYERLNLFTMFESFMRDKQLKLAKEAEEKKAAEDKIKKQQEEEKLKELKIEIAKEQAQIKSIPVSSNNGDYEDFLNYF